MQAREHHFVPQFYLRAFSIDGRSMNCFNFGRGIWIRSASIKHQCSRRNLHSFSPGLEQRLKALEDPAAAVIRDMRRTRALPPIGSIEREWLLAYVAFQKTRTPSATRQVTTFREYFVELLGEHAPLPDELLDNHPLALTLNLTKDIIPIAADLEMHLIVNNSGIEFITSDDPVIVHNQYGEGVKYRGVIGWACTGLQIFFPISPTEMLVLFDRDVYRVGQSQRGESVTIASDRHDVEMLNSLQIHNAECNVYFAGQRNPQLIVQQCNLLLSKRRRSRFTFIETERVKESPTRDSAIIGHHEDMLPVRLSTSLIAIRKSAKQVPVAARIGYRNNARRQPPPARDNRGEGKRYPFKTITKK